MPGLSDRKHSRPREMKRRERKREARNESDEDSKVLRKIFLCILCLVCSFLCSKSSFFLPFWSSFIGNVKVTVASNGGLPPVAAGLPVATCRRVVGDGRRRLVGGGCRRLVSGAGSGMLL